MTWRDRLQRASFRGIPIYVDGTTAGGGRRVVLKRLAGGGPGSIVPVDLNEEPDELDVVAFLWGPDYDIARDRLERAIKEGGPGELVVPTRGTLRVRVTRGPQTIENRGEGGYCTIRFTVYVEAQDASGLRAQVDTGAAVKTAATHVAAAVRADAAAHVTTQGFTSRQLARVTGLVSDLTRVVGRANRVASGVLGPVRALTRELDALNAQAVTLMSTPDLYATTLLDLVFTAYSLPETVVGGAERLLGVPAVLSTTAFGRGRAARLVDRVVGSFAGFGGSFDRKPKGSEARRAEDVAMATARLVRAASVAAASSAYADADFDSATFAVGALGRTIAEVDALALLEPPDDVFAALEDLRAALARHIFETGSKLPETVTAELRQPVPALLLAYVLYGDANLEADIVARNRLAEPLFVQGRIEVLRP